MTGPFLDALLGCNRSGRPPIWLMRQAGRYLPEYQALRRHYSLLSMFHHPEIIAQVTAMPLQRFGFDAAILYTDILIILEALGIYWNVKPGFGPVIEPQVTSLRQVEEIEARPAKEALHFALEGIELLRPTLHVPLIGFCGGPFTIASYLVEGRSSRDLKTTKQWMYRQPASFHCLLELLADTAADFLNCQIDAGVDAIQIFDSWAHVLTPHRFREFCLPYYKRIMGKLTTPVPVILFCKGSQSLAPLMADADPAAISLDWQCDLNSMRQRIPQSIALQGNLDPCALYAPNDILSAEIDRVLESRKHDPAFIFNLGHGILPDTPIEAVELLVDRVRQVAA